MNDEAEQSNPSTGSTPAVVNAMNPSDPSGPPIKVRFPENVAWIVCPDCGEVVGGGDPDYLWLSTATKNPCLFCGGGPPAIESGGE